MKAISFYKCDIQDTSFINCCWQGKDRIILKEEFYLKEDNTYLEDDVNYTLGDLEYNYRQLKKNFDNNKNWVLSGFAYVNENKATKPLELRRVLLMVYLLVLRLFWRIYTEL